jgi:6-phosphofructokinase 1
MKYTPSSALGSCRYKLKNPEDDDTDYKRILEIFKKYDVRYFFYNGGNDSMDTCNKISKFMLQNGYECRVMGIPKTIDNDVPYADITFGFTTALGIICEAVNRVRTTAFSHDRVQVLEVMGRNCGWLALEGGLSGGADIILLPEIPYDVNKIAEVIKNRDAKGLKDTVIVVSEGAKPKDGDVVIKKIVADSADTVRLGGVGDHLASQLEALLGGKEVRATNIGHIQRGGETCQYDRSLCTKLGSLAVDSLFAGRTGEMVTIYNAIPQTVSLEKVLGSGATGETSKGGNNNVDPNGFVVKTARNIGISFGD